MPVTFHEKYKHSQPLPKLAVRASVYVFSELLRKKTSPIHRHSQFKSGGFTLLELLVVVALMAMVAGVAVLALENTSDDAAIPIARSEMVEISKALRQFKRDTGVYPSLSHPADFSALISSGLPLGLTGWNIDTGRGWRGPYLTQQGGGLVTLCNTLLADGIGSPSGCAAASLLEMSGMADVFEHKPDDNDTPNDNTDDSLVWRACTDAGNEACNYRPKWGRPYLLFDMNNDKARIVSMGSNGQYDGINLTDICAPNKDDLALCLK